MICLDKVMIMMILLREETESDNLFPCFLVDKLFIFIRIKKDEGPGKENVKLKL